MYRLDLKIFYAVRQYDLVVAEAVFAALCADTGKAFDRPRSKVFPGNAHGRDDP